MALEYASLALMALLLGLAVWLWLLGAAKTSSSRILLTFIEATSDSPQRDTGLCLAQGVIKAADALGDSGLQTSGVRKQSSRASGTPLEIGIDTHSKYSGLLALPTRVYEGDSANIIVELAFGEASETAPRPKKSRRRTVESIALSIPGREPAKECYLAVELMAAAVAVDGERKQRRKLWADNPDLTYIWNCHFPNSGTHTIALVFKVIGPTEETDVQLVERTIRVAKLDHMTKRQVWILASLASVVTGVIGVAEVLRRMRVW